MDNSFTFKFKINGYTIITGLIIAFLLYSMVYSGLQYHALKNQFLTEFKTVTANFDNMGMPKMHNIDNIHGKETLLINL